MTHVNVTYIYMRLVMDITAKLDEVPKPIWIALMILGFIAYWPIGLLILAYLIWSRRMGCWSHARGRGREQEQGEFVEFLGPLRFAKDRAEFDQFMADRGSRPQGPEPQPQA